MQTLGSDNFASILAYRCIGAFQRVVGRKDFRSSKLSRRLRGQRVDRRSRLFLHKLDTLPPRERCVIDKQMRARMQSFAEQPKALRLNYFSCFKWVRRAKQSVRRIIAACD